MLRFIGVLLRSTFAISFFALLTYASFLAGKQALAAFNAAYANVLVEDSQHSPSAYEVMAVAIELDPHNPDYWRQYAILARLQGDYEQEDLAYQKALLSRPAWPYDWAAAARSLAERGHYDALLTLALQRSMALGPSERAMQYSNAVTALVFWYHLTPEQRHIVEPSVEFVLRHHRDARRFYQLIVSENRRDLFCRRFQHSIDYGPAWCHQLMKQATPVNSGGYQRVR